MIIKRIVIILGVFSIFLMYIEAKEKTTPITKEIKYEVHEIHDTTLNNGEKLNKLLKKGVVRRRKTVINGKKVVYIEKAKNIKNVHVKNIFNKNIKRIFNTTKIANHYYQKTSQCSKKCGVAIKKWENAKKYCNIRGSSLPSKSQIEKSNRYQRKECLNCSYWTNSESKRPNGKSYPHKKVFVYNQAEDDFFSFATKYTYLATCLSN
jgi:predicted transcriptional regulator